MRASIVVELHAIVVIIPKSDGMILDGCTGFHHVHGAFEGKALRKGIANIKKNVHALSNEAGKLSEVISRNKKHCSHNPHRQMIR